MSTNSTTVSATHSSENTVVANTVAGSHKRAVMHMRCALFTTIHVVLAYYRGPDHPHQQQVTIAGDECLESLGAATGDGVDAAPTDVGVPATLLGDLAARPPP